MESIEKHIEKDKEILQDPTTSPQQRRHIEGELHELEDTQKIIKKKSQQEIIMIQLHWNSIAKWNQMQTNVECTTTEYGTRRGSTIRLRSIRI